MIDKLVPAYRQLAADGGNFFGLSILNYEAAIGKLIRQHDVKTMLDFGCGRGDAYKTPHRIWKKWGLSLTNVHLYDPSFPERATPPAEGRKFDLVLCSDVLEHIPEDEVDAFIARLFSFARTDKTGVRVWASVCCRPAKKKFPDGTNLHCTIKPYQWWHDTFVQHGEAAGCIDFVLVESP